MRIKVSDRNQLGRLIQFLTLDPDALVTQVADDEIEVSFVGGFHLTGAIFEPIIQPTVDAFVASGIQRLLPAHCTGWRAVHQLARALPEAFVQPAVGTVVTI